MLSLDPSQNAAKATLALNAARDLQARLAVVEIQDFLAIVDENAALVEKNQTLKTDIEGHCRSIAELQGKVDSLQKVSQEKNDLSTALAAAQEELKQIKKQMASKEADMKNALAAVNKELAAERAELQILRSLSTELIPVSPECRNKLQSRLNKIFSSARAAAEEYFNQDLPPEVLANGSLWDNARTHRAVNRDIPLPLSNTTLAKEMRVAAFLAILANEMGNHVFQPTYLLPDTSGLGDTLEELAGDDSGRDTYLRSVLLAATAHAPKRTNSATNTRIGGVVLRVFECTQPLVPEGKQDGFKSKLTELCVEAIKEWKFIQKLKSRIEPDFDAAENDVATWEPLTTIKPSPPPVAAATKARPNGTASTSNAGGKNSKSASQETQSQAHLAAAQSLTNAVTVWPAFYDRASEEMETLVPGYLLTATQVAKAMAEEKAHRQSVSGPHREQRGKSRRMSAAGGGSTVNGQQNGGSPNGSFLSHKSGGGRNGA